MRSRGRSRSEDLNDNAMRFCAEFVKSNDRLDAAVKAGYTKTTATVKTGGWLKDPRYIREINRLRGIVGEEVERLVEKIIAKNPKMAPHVPDLPEAPDTSDVDAAMRAHGAEIAKAAAEVGLSKKWVLEQLTANHLLAVTGEKPNIPASNKALELIGTELGMFVRRQHVEFEGIDKLSPEDANAELTKALREMGGQIPPDLLALMTGSAGPLQ